jgi:hypothetical protein
VLGSIKLRRYNELGREVDKWNYRNAHIDGGGSGDSNKLLEQPRAVCLVHVSRMQDARNCV